MKKKLPLIIGIPLVAIIIIVGIILGLPKEETDGIFELSEPILYIKSHATLKTNTNLEMLNQNYTNILKRNGLKSNNISLFLEGTYTQNDNVYSVRFVSEYGDTYFMAFNLETNEVAIRKITEEELAQEALTEQYTEL